MAGQFHRSSLGPGVHLRVLSTEKFKTNTVLVYFHTPLQAETATTHALLPMLLTRASAEYPTTAELAGHLDHLYGASLSADVTLFGEVQSLVFRLETVDDRFLPAPAHLFEQGLETLAGLLLRPCVEGSGFQAAYVEQEAANLRNRIEALVNDRRHWALIRSTEVMCEGEPYALHRLGSLEGLRKVSPQKLLTQHQKVLGSAPVDIVVVGSMEPERVRTLIESTLILPAAGPRSMPSTEYIAQPRGKVREVAEEREGSQAILVIGLRTGATMPDEQAYYPMLVANAILGGFPHSKLFQEVREEHSLAYYAYSMVDSLKGIGYMYAGIDAAQKDACQKIMLRQLNALQQGELTNEEFETTIHTLVNETLAAQDSPDAIAELAVDERFSSRGMSIEERVEGYKRVAREDAIAAAQRFSVDTIYFLNALEVE